MSARRKEGRKVACKVGKIWDRDKARDDVETSSSREGSVSRVAEKGQRDEAREHDGE